VSDVTGARAMAEQLRGYGVRYVFGTCGHTNIALLAAFDEVGIDFVIARHEQAAAHAADGYARMTGHPGVLLVHVHVQMPEQPASRSQARAEVDDLRW